MSDNDELRARGAGKTLAQFQPSTESWSFFSLSTLYIYIFINKITIK